MKVNIFFESFFSNKGVFLKVLLFLNFPSMKNNCSYRPKVISIRIVFLQNILNINTILNFKKK